MLSLVEDDPSNLQLKDYAWMYYYTGMISSGFALNEDPDFSGRLYRIMQKKMSVDPSEPLVEPDLSMEDEEEEESEENDVEVLDEQIIEVIDDVKVETKPSYHEEDSEEIIHHDSRKEDL